MFKKQDYSNMSKLIFTEKNTDRKCRHSLVPVIGPSLATSRDEPIQKTLVEMGKNERNAFVKRPQG